MPTGTYTPLTKDQYQKAISSGFSPTQILQNEQKRKASYTSQPVDTTPPPINYSPSASLKELYGETQPSKGYFSSVMDTYASLPDKISQDVQEGASDIEKSYTDKSVLSGLEDFGKGIVKGGIRTAADAAEAIFAPLSEGINQVMDKSGAQALIQKGANALVDATGITDNKTMQNWVMAHPNAADDFGRALTLIMSKGDKSDITKNISDDSSSIKKGTQQIGRGEVPTDISTAIKKVIKYSSDVKDFFKNATSGDMSKRALQRAKANNGILLDQKTQALTDAEASQKLLKTAQDKQQSLADEKQSLIDQKKLELEQLNKDKVGNSDKIKSTTDSYNEKLKDNAIKNRHALSETQKAQNDLKAKQDNLEKLEQDHKDQVNDTTQKVDTALRQSGFSNISKGISDFLGRIRKSADEIYDNVPKDKVELTKIFKGMSDYIADRYANSDRAGAEKMELNRDELKIRDYISKHPNPNTDINEGLRKLGVNSKLYANLTYDEIRQKYPELNSDNLKGTRNTFEDDIRKNNTPALKSFTDNVKSGFKEAFGDAIKSGEQNGTNPPGTLAKLNANDATYSDLMKNPLWEKVQKGEDISPNDVKNNWEKFKTTAENVPAQVDENGNPIEGTSGADIIKKVQNTLGSQILSNADPLGNGKYNVDTIMKGIKNQGEMLGNDVKSTLQGIIDFHTQLEDSDKATQDSLQAEKESLKSSVSETKSLYQEHQRLLQESKAKEISTQKIEQEGITEKSKLTAKELSDLKKQKANIEKTKDEIAKNPIAFIKQVQSFTSDDWKNYLETTGKTVDEVRPVIISTMLKDSGFEILGRNTNFNFDGLKDFFNNVNKLGGGDIDIQKEILGDDTVNKLNDLKDSYDEYEKLKGTKSKTLAGKALSTVFHAVLAAGGLGFGRFFGIRGLLNDFGLSKRTEDNLKGTERTPIPKSNPKVFTKDNIETGVLNVIGGQQNKDQNKGK